MFILNAFCCASDEPQVISSVKAKPIKKILTEHIDFNTTTSPTPIQMSPTENSHHSASSSFEAVTPTLSKIQIPAEAPQSNQSNAGTDITSLKEPLSDAFVSPINFSKVSSHQKQNEPFSMSSKSLNGSDFIQIDVKQWSVKDVLKFLCKIGMRSYNTTFYKNKIKGKDFISLTEKELKQDLQIQEKDIKTLTLYIQLLKERADRESKEKGFSKAFNGRRKRLSLYKSFSNTYSSRKILSMVKNPILEQDGQEDHEHHERKGNMTTKDIYSTSNFSDLLTN